MSEPAVSIVVPTRERPRSLRRCLEALGRLRAPDGGFEVVVACDGVDREAEAIAEAAGVRWLRGPGAGPGSARNAGAASANGRLLAFTDDDCEPVPGWLLALAAAAASAPGCGFGGRTLNGVHGNLYSEASQAIVDAFTDWSNASGVPFFASNNLALDAAGFAEIGGFDESYPGAAGEDRDLCARWRGSGRELLAVPDAVVRHMRTMDLPGLWRQQYGYGRGARRFLANHPREAALRDPGFAAALRARIATSTDSRRARLWALAGLSQLATAAGWRHG